MAGEDKREAHRSTAGSPSSPRTRTGAGGAEPTRERVMRVAAELFAARGFDATGIQDISDLAGIGRGALYYHIKSKQDVLYTIAIELLERVCAEGAQIVGVESPVEQRLTALARHLMADLAHSRDAWTISMRDWMALSPERIERVLELREQYEQLWQQLFEEGYRSGVFCEVDPALGRGILGMFTASYRWIDLAGPLTPEQIADMYVGFAFNGIHTVRPNPSEESARGLLRPQKAPQKA